MKRFFSAVTAICMICVMCAVPAFADNKIQPVYASDLNPGRYNIEVAVSKSEIVVESCVLNVSGTSMTAEMTMLADKANAFYRGSAANADLSTAVMPDTDENGKLTYSISVDALDKSINCAFYNAEKDVWTDRILFFRSASLPESAFRDAEGGEVNPILIVIVIAVIAAIVLGVSVYMRLSKKNKE